MSKKYEKCKDTRPLNSVFDTPVGQLIVKECTDGTCSGCALNGTKHCCCVIEITGDCSKEKRFDHKSVIFARYK